MLLNERYMQYLQHVLLFVYISFFFSDAMRNFGWFSYKMLDFARTCILIIKTRCIIKGKKVLKSFSSLLKVHYIKTN